ncbi:MAG: zinc-dependent alcohol dehydrogenase [Christensenellales bacterium]|jgi:2-desacetyl-2-hydroxyethyl bacteriochlorophyllide A dehydrogenase
MRVLMYYGPENMKVAEQPEPSPKDNEVKLKMLYVGICGSDVHGYLGTTGRRTPPMVMGHEFSAEVVEIGKNVTKFKVGDIVTALPIYNCGECPNCLEGAINACDNREFMGTMDVDGAFAEYLCCDENIVYKLPDTLDSKVGALLEPFAVAYHAVGRAMPLEGKNVMVIGAGTIGLLVMMIAKHFGAKNIVVTDLSDDRLDAAKKFGADITINSGNTNVGEALEAEGLRKSIDVTFEAVGITPTAQQSVEYVRNRGTVVWVGNSAQMININMQQIVTRELSVLGTYIYIVKDYVESIELLDSGKIDISGLISDVVGMDEAEDMFKLLAAGDTTKIKILVDMQR